MITEIANNPILEIVERSALVAAAFVPLRFAVVQGLKQFTGLDGTQ
jgi:hypothetical protein